MNRLSFRLRRSLPARFAALFWCAAFSAAIAADPLCPPGWQGSVVIGCDTLARWSVESAEGCSGSLRLSGPIVSGSAITLSWNVGTGDWVQAKYTFAAPVDLSRAEIFGVSLRGGGPAERPMTVAIMFADTRDVFYGYDLPGPDRGVNEIGRPLFNLPFPKKALWFFFSFGAQTEIDWSQINRFFVVIKRAAPGAGGGAGEITFDHLEQDRASLWPRQTGFEAVSAPPDVASRAIDYIVSQQKGTGLFTSWKEEQDPKAWLYDQALALIALTREGSWDDGAPANDAARAAASLVGFLARVQKADGHWDRGWNPDTGRVISTSDWVGDQAWCVLALARYARASGSAAAEATAQDGADWLVARIDGDGKLAASTEGTVDGWWALMATGRSADADRIKEYLLSEDMVWDPDLRYWWRGYRDPVVALDVATWVSAFARHPLVGATDRALAALSFVRRTLVTSSDDGSRCGLDGQGPVTVWNEGTAQYVAAGGEDAQAYLDDLVAAQRPDGSMAGSPDTWESDCFGWLSPWSGIAPTAWLYFAATGLPFPMGVGVSLLRGDANADGQRTVADAVCLLSYLFGSAPDPCKARVAACLDAGDANDDGAVDLSDPIKILLHLFGAAGPLPAPFQRCGEDPSDDGLGCSAFSPCF